MTSELSDSPVNFEPNHQEFGIRLDHDLNKQKQVDKLIFNTNRESVSIEINCNDELLVFFTTSKMKILLKSPITN